MIRTRESNDEKISFYLYFKEIEYELKEEYILFDSNAIVASIGGSLGMFLGVSCLGLGSMLLRQLKTFSSAKNKNKILHC